eukprot:8370184-Lingulodinium_polyedra.AAC.1
MVAERSTALAAPAMGPLCCGRARRGPRGASQDRGRRGRARMLRRSVGMGGPPSTLMWNEG